GTAIVAFDQSGITQISIKYQNVNLAFAQAIGLHDISFDAPPVAPQLDLNPADARPYALETFSSASYSNASGGALPWNGNWVETDAAGGGAAAGNVKITGGELSISKASQSIQRAIDLSAQSTDYLNRLSFDYRTTAGVDLGSDQVDVQISSNGGTSWTTLDVLDFGGSASGSKSYDITAYAGADTRAHYEQVLRTVQFSSTSDDPTVAGTNTARVVSFVVTDSTANASNTARTTVNVVGVNDAPTLTVTAGNPTFTEGPGSSQ